MKTKTTLSIVLAILFVISNFSLAFAAPSKSNSLYITGDGLRINGNGVTSNSASNVTYVRVSCTMYSSIDGYNYPLSGPAIVERWSPGSVAARTSTLIEYHHGETIKNYCTHEVNYSNGSKWNSTSTKYLYIS